MQSTWNLIDECTYQRADGMAVFPSEYGGWVVAHPNGELAPQVFRSAEVAMAATDRKDFGIPVIRPTDTWIN